MLALKVFATKNYLLNSNAISNLNFAFDEGKQLFSDGGRMKLQGDLMLEIESIKKELN